MVTVAVNAVSIPGFGQQQFFVEKFKPICDTQKGILPKKNSEFQKYRENCGVIVCMCVSAPKHAQISYNSRRSHLQEPGIDTKIKYLVWENCSFSFLRQGKL